VRAGSVDRRVARRHCRDCVVVADSAHDRHALLPSPVLRGEPWSYIIRCKQREHIRVKEQAMVCIGPELQEPRSGCGRSDYVASKG